MIATLAILGVSWYSAHAALEEKLAALRAEGLPTNAAELAEYYNVPAGVPDTTDVWVGIIENIPSPYSVQSEPMEHEKEAECELSGHPSCERGMAPRPTLPMRQAAQAESFKWKVQPGGEMFEGDIYPDGSALDGPTVELMRCGWSFVVLCQRARKIIASAYGVPPPMDHVHRRGGSVGHAPSGLEDDARGPRFKGD